MSRVAEVTDGSVQISRGNTGRPDATLTTDIDTLRAVCAGRRTRADAVRCGDLHLDGDQQAAKRLADLLLAPFSALPA